MASYFAGLILLVLAWGAFAFGAVYPWAYAPLFWATGVVGHRAFRGSFHVPTA